MVDSRIFTGGLNQDTADEFLQPGDYKYAMNIDPGPDGVTKLFGNIGLDDLPAPPDGVDWVCGSHFDKTRQRVFYFVFNSEGYHRIVLVEINQLVPESSSSTILFQDRTNTQQGIIGILNWGIDDVLNPDKLIKDIKIIYRDNGDEGDLVYFIDPLKRPLKFNTVTLPILASTNDVILDYFKVIKAPPDRNPVCNYYDVADRNINNLRKKLFQFKSRFIYDDDEKSVWSAISKVPLPPKSNDESYYADGTKANGLFVQVQTGNKLVKKIEIAARVNIDSVWSNFFLVDTLNKSALSLQDNVSYSYSFLNDGAYIPIEIEESNLLFDYVPDKANTLELANGNTLVYAGIREGLDRVEDIDIDIDTIQEPAIPDSNLVVNINPGAVIGLFEDTGSGYPVLFGYRSNTYSIEMNGSVIPGDIINMSFSIIQTNDNFVTWTQITPTPSISYTVPPSSTVPSVAAGIVALINAITPSYFTATLTSVGNLQIINITVNDSNQAFYLGLGSSPGDYIDAIAYTYTPSPSTSASSDVISSLKWLGRYKYGIVYYNNDGKTNGVYTGDDKRLTIDIPKYTEVTGVPNLSKIELSINHAPPSWAKYYHLVRTKELTSSFSKFIITKSTDLSEVSLTPAYVYINIENLTLHGEKFTASSTIINYSEASFVKGDRIRFIKNVTSDNVFADNKDYEILGLEQRPYPLTSSTTTNLFIKLAYVAGMPISMTNTNQYLVEIFRPAKILLEDEQNFYYEIGERYRILTDVNGNFVHEGNVQTQIIDTNAQPAILNHRDGDYYIKLRKLTTGQHPNNNNVTTYTTMDANFSDFWESAVWGQGRPLIIDESAKSQYFPVLMRFSQSFIQGTNINNLNRFYPENFEEADNSFGDILRLKTRENFIRLFQRYKVGMIPIYRSIIVDNAASSQVAISERLLNKPNYYAGEYGIDKYGSSLVSTDYGDYFIDTINRAIIRVSLDGMTNISDTYNMAAYANGAMNDSSYGYGYFNYETRSVVILVAKLGQTPSIISYSESRKNFESFHGYTGATSFQFVNGHLWSFYEKPYVHNQSARNNFYGVQQSCSISTVFNGNVQVKKTYMAIELLSTELWSSSMQTGPLLNQQTTIEASDYAKTIGNITIQNKENKYNATIKRDMSSAGGKYFGDSMKGNFAQVALFNSTSGNSRLISVSLKYIQSPLTNT
jgi:hypothetical protein